MEIFEFSDKEKYNSYLLSQKQPQFLQSWEWGEFNKSIGYTVKRVGVEDSGELIFAFTLIKKSLPLGKSYFYGPKIAVKIKEEKLKFIFKEIKKTAQKESAIFFRFEPLQVVNSNFYNLTKTIDVQPANTLILDLEKTGDELLKDMHQKTRYNIRLAQKKGVKIIEAGIDRFEDFWQLMEQTKERDAFRLHEKEYYQKMLAVDFIKLYLAEYDNKIIAGSIVAFFGQTATYVHGASGNENRNVMAPFLLQWESIKTAKAKGMKFYDFYGIDEAKWPGVTRFKLGFGGEKIRYPGTYDLVFSKIWYNAYKLIRKIRRSF